VVAAVSDRDGLLEAVTTHEPDVVVTDVRMPPGFKDEGLRAALELRRRCPRLPVLVLSQYVETRYATDLLNAGDGTHVGYLLKDRIGHVNDFVDALRRVAEGGTVVDPEVVRQMLRRHRDPLDSLTAREREVLALVAEGRSNLAIATALHVAEASVAKHIRSILNKLGLPLAEETHRRVLAVLTFLRS
jgi:DNA-binding NarL/FixJ family response regulator